MATPRFWTDPLSGANYSFGDKLPSSDFNAFLAGWRTTDLVLEWNQITNWPVQELALVPDVAAAGYDKRSRRILLLEDVTADTSPAIYYITHNGAKLSLGNLTAPAGGWTTSNGAAIGSNSTTTLIGGATVNASAEKIVTLIDGTLTTRSMSNAEANVGPQMIVWDSYNSLFIAGLNGTGATGKIETSPDGITWTARTVATVATPSAIATSSAGVSVALLATNTNVALRSVNGTTWSNVTLPATSNWSCVAYVEGLGKWFAADGSTAGSTTNTNTNYASSTDGSTWSAESVPTGFTYPPRLLGSTGNLLLMVEGYGTNGELWASDDGSWPVPITGSTTLISDIVASTDNVAHWAANEISVGAYFAT